MSVAYFVDCFGILRRVFCLIWTLLKCLTWAILLVPHFLLGAFLTSWAHLSTRHQVALLCTAKVVDRSSWKFFFDEIIFILTIFWRKPNGRLSRHQPQVRTFESDRPSERRPQVQEGLFEAEEEALDAISGSLQDRVVGFGIVECLCRNAYAEVLERWTIALAPHPGWCWGLWACGTILGPVCSFFAITPCITRVLDL